MKKLRILPILITLVSVLTACSGGAVAPTVVDSSVATSGSTGESVSAAASTPAAVAATSPITVEYDEDDLDARTDGPGTSIHLEGDAVRVEGAGAMVSGNHVLITSAGMYHVRGTLNDGQILVDTQDPGTVKLVLNGAIITCSSSAPIYVVNADKVVITLAEGTENVITDGESYLFEGANVEEPNGAIFSNDDLTINGGGSLIVHANYNHGIVGHDDLRIIGGRITVYAVNDGIKGRDSVVIRDGTVTVNAGGDGIQSNDDEDATKGYVYIEGGRLHITAGRDGIQAQTHLIIRDGEITISTGGGSSSVAASGDAGSVAGGPMTGGRGWGMGMEGNPNKPAFSAKGLKTGGDITITGGSIHVDSADDAVHANGRIAIAGGTLSLSSGDDGVHADSDVEIHDGDIHIATCYEGIEGNTITVNGGNVFLTTRDDGFNAVDPNAGLQAGMMRPGPGGFNISANSNLFINEGYIVIDAAGDGLDINGSVRMTGGTVIVHGPTVNNNGAIDYLGTFEVTGGLLVAAGSSGMAQAPGTSSTQYSIIIAFPSVLPAGTIVHIETESGEDILTFAPNKPYQSLVLSSAELKPGATCVVYTGGTATGAVRDGLYSGGTYSGGTQMATFTVSGAVTGVGAVGAGFPGMPGGGMRPQPGTGFRPGGGRPSGQPFPTPTPTSP